MSLENEKQLKTKKIMSLMSLYPIKTVVKISLLYIASKKRLIRLIRLIRFIFRICPKDSAFATAATNYLVPGDTALRLSDASSETASATSVSIPSTEDLEHSQLGPAKTGTVRIRGSLEASERCRPLLSESGFDSFAGKKVVPSPERASPKTPY